MKLAQGSLSVPLGSPVWLCLMLSLGLKGRCATPISASKSTRPAVCRISCLTQHTSPHFRLLHNARPKSVCRAEERSRESLKLSDKEKLIVPDTPPSKEAGRTSEVSFVTAMHTLPATLFRLNHLFANRVPARHNRSHKQLKFQRN